jgi:hypothetical protein
METGTAGDISTFMEILKEKNQPWEMFRSNLLKFEQEKFFATDRVFRTESESGI